MPATDPPKSADLVVVGAGYTGLNAALAAAKAGLDVVVLDREHPGSAASGRNGGHISTSMKPGLAELSARIGETQARQVLGIGFSAVRYLNQLIAQEGIDCHLETCGHFTGAHKPSAMTGLAAWAEEQQSLGNPVELVRKQDQRSYCGTDHFHGGVFMPAWQSLHPGRYVAGLTERVMATGARIHGAQEVVSLAQSASGVQVGLAGGAAIRARSVIVATNAQTGPATPRLRRQIIPIASVQIATEALDKALVAELHPRRAMSYDSRRLVTYTRPSPDGTRVLVGSRVRFRPGDPEASRHKMHARMERFFPELRGVRSQYLWGGLVGYTFDHLPHIGSDGAVHHAMGYCGTGVAMASYFGNVLGRRAAGEGNETLTPLDGMPFASAPFYRGRPWFLPFAFAWYAFKDRFG
ncbi:NAD(P)/FAD-dependent oxidoreductase [Mesorhizobium sp. NZP2298]|uniref:NAD(P)/FAD-dependent oxidoreductase n=1 Tax=Mesorhizobium sp. NZP2298 TaxID=2483403 RepID=UPI001FEDE29F|nr:FAD-dependent oxidoreductase [Mesorhizobium sp. NZP2298]